MWVMGKQAKAPREKGKPLGRDTGANTGCWGKHVVDEDENRLFGAQLDALPDHVPVQGGDYLTYNSRQEHAVCGRESCDY